MQNSIFSRIQRFGLLVGAIAITFSSLSAQKSKASAAPSQGQSLAQQIEASFNTFKTTGLAVAIVKDGQVILSKGFGLANADTKDPVTSNSLFNIASCSKAFTAASIGLLVEEGKLRWEDKVIDYIPGFQLSDPWITGQMTVKDLLCHRSGLGTFDGDLLWYASNYTDAQIVEHMRYLPIHQGFRSDFGYQNNMYTVAGMIIQKVTGRTWSQFVAERLFTPLGMKNSFPSNDEIPRSTRIAMGHVDGKVIPIYDYEGGKPAAAIYSSVDDLSHWIQMWLEGGKWAGQKILDPRTMRMMQTAQTNIGVSPVWESWGVHFRAYGLGWSLFDYAGKKVVEHNGGMPGYISKVTLIPESNLGFVILNNGNDGTVNEAIRFKILDVLLDHLGKDWDKVYKNFADMGAAGLASETAAREKSRVPNTKPSLALKAYTGTFADPSYGTVSVTESASGDLFFAMDQSKLLFSGNMEHFHLDTWKVQFNDPYLPFALISFEIGPKGDVLGFKIDLPNDDFHFDVLDFKRTNP